MPSPSKRASPTTIAASARASIAHRLAPRCAPGIALWASLALIGGVGPGGAGDARAEEPPSASGAIGAGHEGEVLALSRPIAPGGPILDGWTLTDVRIQMRAIDYEVRGPSGERGGFSLFASPDRERLEHTASFAITRLTDGDRAAGPAIDRLLATIRRNDAGTFWARVAPASAANRPPPAAVVEDGDAKGHRWKPRSRRSEALVVVTAMSLAALLAALRRATSRTAA